MIEFSIDRQLFFVEEEFVIFRFINDFIVLGFSFRLKMIKEKTLFFFKARCQNPSIFLRQYWIVKFLNRHLNYWIKFPRHLNQKRHWNSNFAIFVKWFELYKKTYDRYDIAIKNQYNMNEKNFMMKMNENIK